MCAALYAGANLTAAFFGFFFFIFCVDELGAS